MTSFEIIIDGHIETIHAKHLGGGKYHVRHLRTCNFADVKTIETKFSNAGNHQYHITEFYPTSEFAGRLADIRQKVVKIEPDID